MKSTSFVYVEGFTIWPLEAGGATIATAAVVEGGGLSLLPDFIIADIYL